MILDLFAGPRGWSEGLKMLGLTDIGIEWDDTACRTAIAAGHPTIRADVAAYPTEPFAGKVTGLIASPPCQDFSAAGKKAGRGGKTGQLIDEVPRWVDALRPEWVACEQVPGAKVVYQEFAHLFATWGYDTWVGVLNAADYGVPQTRKRVFLLASRVGPVHPPEPTHAKAPEPTLFGTLQPWVSMADALGWPDHWEARKMMGAGMIERHGDRPGRPATSPAPTLRANGGGNATPGWVVHTNRGQDADGNRQQVGSDRPAPALTGKSGGQWQLRPGQAANATVRAIEHPAPTVKFGHDAARWAFERPATTVAGDPRCWPPGHKINAADIARLGAEEAAERYGNRAGTDAVRLSVEDALVLQSFRADYPVQGGKTKAFTQVGNAVPPLLAAHVLAAVIPGVG